jgi:hypothetical protein
LRIVGGYVFYLSTLVKNSALVEIALIVI